MRSIYLFIYSLPHSTVKMGSDQTIVWCWDTFWVKPQQYFLSYNFHKILLIYWGLWTGNLLKYFVILFFFFFFSTFFLFFSTSFPFFLFYFFSFLFFSFLFFLLSFYPFFKWYIQDYYKKSVSFCVWMRKHSAAFIFFVFSWCIHSK